MSSKYKWNDGKRVRLVAPDAESISDGFEAGMEGKVWGDHTCIPLVIMDNGGKACFYDNELELIQERQPAQEPIWTGIPQWETIHHGTTNIYESDVFGEVFVTNGKIVSRIRPEHIDRTWTHWKPTGITELPQSKAREAFEKEWEPHQGSHKSVAEEWFIKGYNTAMKQEKRSDELPQ